MNDCQNQTKFMLCIKATVKLYVAKCGCENVAASALYYYR